MFVNLVDLCSDCALIQRNKELEEENIKLKFTKKSDIVVIYSN